MKSDRWPYVITDPIAGHAAFPRFLNEGNLDAIVGLYADDAVMVVDGGATIAGKDAIRAYLAEAMKDFDHIGLQTLWQVRYTDTAVFRSVHTLYFRTEDGGLVKVTASGIEVERLQPDGTWLFIVDHHVGGAALDSDPVTPD
jgi:ketosteroid isomerase-like protein